MDLGIKNKVALVTAASQGLGKASAIELANEGVKLAICSRDQDKINQTAEEIQNLTGGEVLAVKADLDSTDDIENLIKEIEKDKGSKFYINDKEARAKDAQMFFADLSTGAHSPSIISQGRIGALVTAKPSDRRSILEEAAVEATRKTAVETTEATRKTSSGALPGKSCSKRSGSLVSQ